MQNIHLVTKQIFFWVMSQLKKRKEPEKRASCRPEAAQLGARRCSRAHTHLPVGAALGSAAWRKTVTRKTAHREFQEDFRAPPPQTRCVGTRPSWYLVGGQHSVSPTVSQMLKEVSPPWKLQVGDATSSPLTTRQHRTRPRAPVNAEVVS